MKVISFACIFSLLGITAQGLTDEQKTKVQEYYKECTNSTGADPGVISRAKEGKLPEDNKVNDFIFCFFKKAGFMNEDGELQTEVVKAKLAGDLKENELKTVLDKCNGVTGKNLPDKAANIFKCYYETTPTHISLTF